MKNINKEEIHNIFQKIKIRRKASNRRNFSNKTQIGLFSISIIFLILTIIFGIIFAKHQQKRHRKSFK